MHSFCYWCWDALSRLSVKKRDPQQYAARQGHRRSQRLFLSHRGRRRKPPSDKVEPYYDDLTWGWGISGGWDSLSSFLFEDRDNRGECLLYTHSKIFQCRESILDMLLGVRYGPGYPYSSPSHATAHEANLAFMASGGVWDAVSPAPQSES